MKPLYLLELVLLAALWGASFLFMRIGTPEFGPVALIELRTAIAALFLLPIVLLTKKFGQASANYGLLFIVGLVGTAIPFCLLSYATLFVSAGYASILNAMAPIFTALIAWLWVNDRLSFSAVIGLIIGFGGVFILVFDKQDATGELNIWPVIAGLGATFCYGLGANFTRQKLGHIHPLAIAFGSQLGAALGLLPFSVWLWPQQVPGSQAWISVTVLGIACTGIAFILYFRLIANIGVNKAISVTYLIPLFGVVWGMIFLDEVLSLMMIAGAMTILLGVSLTTGMITFGINKAPEIIKK
jgi:drug/metabolite transporter (DMT)-like permease